MNADKSLSVANGEAYGTFFNQAKVTSDSALKLSSMIKIGQQGAKTSKNKMLEVLCQQTREKSLQPGSEPS